MSKRTLSSDRGPLALANDEFTLLNDLSLGDSESDDEDYTPLLEVEDGSDDSYEDVESDGDDNVSISNASDDGEDDFCNNDDNDDNESDNESVHSYMEHWEDAYHTDTSDEEELRNTVGNIPLEWYDDYPHIGYDLDGKKILKPAQGDQLDEFLKKMDDPNYWRTVTDKVSGKEIILTDEDIDLIQNIQRSQYPENSSNPYEPYVDLYSHEKMIHPVMDRPESKRRFLPSLWERKKIMKLVQGIKSGRIKPVKKPEKPKVYMLWSDQQMDNLRPHQFVPAPKVRLPGHGESYNPPPEYLPTKEERDEWESTDLKERKHFIPTKYESLLSVPAYRYFIHERFNRCLDLYLCPRQTRMRIQVEPEDLIPKLPRPRDLQPFPAIESIVYEGHNGMVRSISIDKSGQWLASVSDDETLKLWEVQTGRCLKTIALKGRPTCVEFSPNASMSLLSVAVGNNIILINHGLGDRLVTTATDSALNSTSDDPTVEGSSSIEWNDCMDTDGYSNGIRITIVHSQVVNQVTWHCKGDYCGTVIGGDGSSTVFIHQLSKKKSQVCKQLILLLIIIFS
jgi:ribosome biogenesis protein ERB1